MENNDNKEAQGINFIKIILLLNIALWVANLIITLLVLDISDFTLEFRDQGRIIQGVLYCVVGFVCIFMVLLLMDIYRKREKNVILLLMGYFILTGIAVFLQGLFGIVEFTVRNFQIFWTDSSMIFLTGAIFCLGCFVAEVFNKGIKRPENQKRLRIFLILIIITDLTLMINTMWSLNFIIIAIPVIPVLMFAIYYFFTLVTQSFKLRKRLESPIEQKAFLYIGMHGILLVIGGLAAALYSITEIFELRYVAAFVLMLAYYSLYKGFTLPMKQK
jgi:hypothetical protein